MRILLDTSVLVAAMVEAHPAHDRALLWMSRVARGSDVGLVAAHSLAEVYAVLTTLPVNPPISPANAMQLIQHNLINTFEIIVLSAQDYSNLLESLSSLGIIGGATYDALILRAAENANVDQVVTLNEKDFRRVNPKLADRIVSP